MKYYFIYFISFSQLYMYVKIEMIGMNGRICRMPINRLPKKYGTVKLEEVEDKEGQTISGRKRYWGISMLLEYGTGRVKQEIVYETRAY